MPVVLESAPWDKAHPPAWGYQTEPFDIYLAGSITAATGQ